MIRVLVERSRVYRPSNVRYSRGKAEGRRLNIAIYLGAVKTAARNAELLRALRDPR